MAYISLISHTAITDTNSAIEKNHNGSENPKHCMSLIHDLRSSDTFNQEAKHKINIHQKSSFPSSSTAVVIQLKGARVCCRSAPHVSNYTAHFLR